MYILHSKIDDKTFEVNQKVIDASVLLKNICDLTDARASISIDCSAFCLETFIKLIEHYETITEVHDIEFERELFQNFTDDMLVALVKEMAILDSDFFFDSVADLILERIKNLDSKQMQEYLELEEDFNTGERECINSHLLEYLISLNIDELKFPFPGTNFITLKNMFETPLNVILSRIIQRSNEKVAFQLSMINKTLKNENDRQAIKLSYFYGSSKWTLQVYLPNLYFSLSPEEHEEKYFNAIKRRKIIVNDSIGLSYFSFNSKTAGIGAFQCSSFDFVIPSNKKKVLNVSFQGNSQQIFGFDIQRCPFPSIFYEFTDINLDFETTYQQLIAKDLSKEIQIDSSNVFDFFKVSAMHIYKKSNATKFHEILIYCFVDKPLPKFKEFLLRYMENEGVIRSTKKMFKIPNSYNRKKGEHIYQVSDAINLL